jgi:NhaA family Na+:H+ antiporter
VWEWAARNLSAAAERLLSPAERMERAVGPWSTYVVLPLFAFSATGVSLSIHLSSPERLHILAVAKLGVLAGSVIAGLVGTTILAKRRATSTRA